MGWIGPAINAVAMIGSSLINRNSGGGGGRVGGLTANQISDMMGLQWPDWYESPEYAPFSAYLRTYGQNLMEGNIPDYYAPIGEYGGQEFQNMMQMINRDVTRSTEENIAARGGGRSGEGTTAISRAVGDASTNLLFADYNRAMTGRMGLLGAGIGLGQYSNEDLWRYSQARLAHDIGSAEFDMSKFGILAGAKPAPSNSAYYQGIGSNFMSMLPYLFSNSNPTTGTGATGGGGGGGSSWMNQQPVGSNFGNSAIQWADYLSKVNYGG